jgi:hypothetical protein
MFATLQGILTLARLVRLANALVPMVVTSRPSMLVGIVTAQGGPEYPAMLALPSAFVL